MAPGIRLHHFESGQGDDVVVLHGGVRAATLVVHGDRDLQSLEATAEYGRAIPGARLERFAASGRFAFVDEAERFGQLVGAFLDGLPD